ncbi:hypothetical protein AB0A74_20150 [Saccharothrix sp. NPDC042600]|uniref:hypothetical protein n=1 Tax=Saccharothrix TaxID=2071 RepID=UPI0033FAE6E5|nr:hypothetical protein GCM10017745_75390 [Saccharothrix mutabilis subsp. capreolus]
MTPSGRDLHVRHGQSNPHEWQEALGALGWAGTVLPDVELFGERVTVVASVDAEVHAQRKADGWGPVTDRTAVAMWSWPENWSTTPRPAVRVVGVVADGRDWMRAIKTAAGFGGFGSTAVVRGGAQPPGEKVLLTAQFRGVGVVWLMPDRVVRLLSPGRVGPVSTSRPTVVSRWVEEVVYERYLAVDGSERPVPA